MARKKYSKAAAIALAATTILQSGAMYSGLFDVDAFAVESGQINEKLTILNKGTELAPEAKLTIEGEGTTSASVVLNETVEIEIPKDTDLDGKLDNIMKKLSEHMQLKTKIIMRSNSNIDGNTLEVTIPLNDVSDPRYSGWLTEQMEGDNNHVTVTTRTKKHEFTYGDKKYIIEPFEHKTVVSLNVSEEGTGKPESGTDKPGEGTTDKPIENNLVSVSVKGTEKVGQTLSSTVIGTDGNEVTSGLTYKWYRLDNKDAAEGILVGESSAYELKSDDANKYLKLVVSNDKNSVSYITGKIRKQSSGSSSSSSSSGSSSSGSSSSSSGSSGSGSSSSSSSGGSDSSSTGTISSNLTTDNDSISSNITIYEGSTAAIQQSSDGVVKLVNEEGEPVTGWQRVGESWYLGDSNGQSLTGWQQVGGTWYFMNTNGVMTTGWQNVGGTWYLMNNSGAMTTGWQQVGGKWYFLQSSGAMKTGWLNDNGTWYYLKDDGSMAANTYIDGYYVGSNGAWVK